MSNPLPDRPLPTSPVTSGFGAPWEPAGSGYRESDLPPLTPASEVSPEMTAEPSYEHVSWRVSGWDPAAPFRGELQFTGSQGQLLLSLPVDPSTMQSLNEITDAVLDAQHEAFGLPLVDDDEDLGDGANKRSRFRLPGKDIGEERTVVDKELFGVPFRINVRPKALRTLGLIVGAILVVAIIGNLLN